MEAATRNHFFNHGQTNKADRPEEEIASCQWCQLRTFATYKSLPITIVNTMDEDVIPRNFRFLDSSVLGEGVEAAAANFRSGCICAEDEDCMYDGCHCLGEMEDSDDEDPGFGRRRKKKFAYYSTGAKAGMLRSKRLQSREPIYECHDGCSCSVNCPNRVVERGRKVPLQIYKTENTGWGVRAMVDIKKGQFVDKYLGEIITSQEAYRRRDESTIAQRKDVYLFALDKFSDPASLDPRLAGQPLEVDGQYMSGPTRFINHSCDPNLRIFARVGDHADKHLHDLALFAIEDIPKGDQLTFDYVDGRDSDDARDPDLMKDMTKCYCGTKNCRGYLW